MTRRPNTVPDGTPPVGGNCRLCGQPLPHGSKRYHRSCHRARPAARYSGPSARRRATALIESEAAR